MPFTTDIRNDFVTVGQAYLGDLTQGGVWFFGSCGVHTSTHTTSLRAIFKRGAFTAGATDCAGLAQELANCWHDLYASLKRTSVLIYVSYVVPTYTRRRRVARI